MPDPAFLSTRRIAILGIGLMGGSLAMALHGKCAALFGIDPDSGALSFALEQGFIDKASTDPAELLPQADMVILAAPVGVILDLLESLPRLHPGKALVLDLGSTKKAITGAMSNLPGRFEAVGGHPICGKEKSGVENADAGLYRGAPFVLTPLRSTPPSAKVIATELIQAAGAYPLWLDAETHDRWIAYTSHLPYLLALALASATPPETSALVGPGFRSTSRVAATPASVMLDILKTNRANILEAIGVFRGNLDRLESGLLAEDWDGMQRFMHAGASRQIELVGRDKLQGGHQ